MDKFKFCWPASWHIRIIWTNKMQYFPLIYFNSKPLHVSSRLAAHHQRDQVCINSNWYSHALCWLAAGNCSLYRVHPPDDEQQACSKHVEAYYWNKLIKNSASYWFILYGFYIEYCGSLLSTFSNCKPTPKLNHSYTCGGLKAILHSKRASD